MRQAIYRDPKPISKGLNMLNMADADAEFDDWSPQAQDRLMRDVYRDDLERKAEEAQVQLAANERAVYLQAYNFGAVVQRLADWRQRWEYRAEGLFFGFLLGLAAVGVMTKWDSIVRLFQ
jgi:hypothetical protein